MADEKRIPTEEDRRKVREQLPKCIDAVINAAAANSDYIDVCATACICAIDSMVQAGKITWPDVFDLIGQVTGIKVMAMASASEMGLEEAIGMLLSKNQTRH